MTARRFILPAVLLLLSVSPGLGQERTAAYVAIDGDDSKPGDRLNPFATIQRAVDSGADDIYLGSKRDRDLQPGELNEFTIDETLTLTGTQRLIGGFDQARFLPDADAPTRIVINVPVPGVGIRLEDDSGLEFVTISGGFQPVRASGNHTIRNCTFVAPDQPAIQSAFITLTGVGESLIEKCTFDKGTGALDLRDTVTATLRESFMTRHSGPAITARNQSNLAITRCVVTGCETDAIIYEEDSTGIVENSYVGRNAGHGIRCVGTSPVIRGNVIALNTHGLIAETGSEAEITNNTFARNRQSGVSSNSTTSTLRQNVFAANSAHGFQESFPGAAASLTENFFHANVLGAVLDNGTTSVLTTEAINNTLVNQGETFGNAVEDPLFLDLPGEDYRLHSGSPAVDLLDNLDPGFLLDAAGNARVVDLAGVGHEGDSVMDAGAIEVPSGPSWDFGALTYDWRPVPQPVPSFSPVSIALVPYGFRLATSLAGAFGWIEHTKGVSEPEPESLLIARYHIASDAATDDGFHPRPRMRINSYESQINFIYALDEVGTFSQVPPIAGRDYWMIADVRNGSLRTSDQPVLDGKYTPFFDYLDFLNPDIEPVTPLLLEEVEIQQVDRAQFDQGFTQLRRFTFDDTSESWRGVHTPPFDRPFFQYDSTRGGLVCAPISSNSYVSWESPKFPVEKGTILRIRWIVKTDQAQPQNVPAFRLRTSQGDFEFTTSLVIEPGKPDNVLAPAVPTSAGVEYVSYTHMPDNLPATNTLQIAFELFGFQERYVDSRIWLDEVTVESRPADPPFFR